MATLEVHDGDGRVQFIELDARSSDPVRHELRLRHGPGGSRHPAGPRPDPLEVERFKVEASPDAEYVLVNGHKMTTSSLDQGDEIAVGDVPDVPAPGRRRRRDVGSRSKAAAEGRANPVMPPPRSCRRPTSFARHAAAISRAQAEPLAGERRLARFARTPQTPERRQPSRRRSTARTVGRAEAAQERRPALHRAPTKAERGGAVRGIERLLAGGGRSAPGRERIATSPLVIGLLVAASILVGMGFWLKSIIAATIATRTFDRGVQDFDDGDYRTAIRDFDSVPVVQSRRSSRRARPRSCGRWPTCGNMCRPTGRRGRRRSKRPARCWSRSASSPSSATERTDLAELVIRIGEGLADARGTAPTPRR